MALLTPKELCAHLKISRATLARLRRRGLPGIGGGRLVRFDSAQAVAWYDQYNHLSPALGMLVVGAYACQKCHYAAAISVPTAIARLQECPECSRERPEKVGATASV